jgi:Zn-dependent membrane protease YugP
MPIIVLLIVVFAVVFLPSWWVKRVLKKYRSPDDRYQGTGGELARHLLDKLGLEQVKVEQTDSGGDHYDPRDRTVRLSPEHYSGRSLTAVTVSAHEVGHAIQHADGYKPLIWRTRLVEALQKFQRIGMGLLVLAPIVMLALRLPRAGIILLGMAVAALASGIVVHLVTLPTEFDASFNRALPLLKKGEYLKPQDHRHAHKILTAAALTYVAGALIGLVNFWWWLRILGR